MSTNLEFIYIFLIWYIFSYSPFRGMGKNTQIRVFDKFTEGRHAVIAVEKQSNGKYRVALKGYRRVTLNEDNWVSCELVSWSGDISEFRHK